MSAKNIRLHFCSAPFPVTRTGIFEFLSDIELTVVRTGTLVLCPWFHVLDSVRCCSQRGSTPFGAIRSRTKGEKHEESHIIFLARARRRQHHCCPERYPVVVSSSHRPSDSYMPAGLPGSKVDGGDAKYRRVTHAVSCRNLGELYAD